jgi:chromosome segregation ATPase
MGLETPDGDRNWESPSSDSSDEDLLSLVLEDVVPGEVDGDLDELDQQVAASEEHIANLEGELKETTDQEAETALRLDSERQRRAALDQQLHEARKETTIRMLHKASQTRNTIVAGAEELLQASRVQGEREANEIAAQRMADLDTEHRELAHRLGMMKTIYDELRATLKVAETSLNELIEAQESLKQLDGVETHQPPIEPNSEQTTSASPPQESAPTDLNVPLRFNGNEPDSAQVEISQSPLDEER